MLESVKLLVDQNADLFAKLANAQKIMKKFFKFQIEEDDMKSQIGEVFADMKDMQRERSQGEKVLDEFSFLAFLSNKKVSLCGW